MSDLPPLEPGRQAFLVWTREHGGRYYEFYRVFDDEDRLVRGESFWITVPGDHEGGESVRTVQFDDLGRALGREAPQFPEFSSEMLDTRLLDQWFDAVKAPAIARHTSPPPSESLLWFYTGVRLETGAWMGTSGYVPNEGRDNADLAEEAAAILFAERVILHDAAGRVLSIRDRDGALVESPDEIVELLRADSLAHPETGAPIHTTP